MNYENRIDQIFARWNKDDSPGGTIAIAKGDHIIFQKGYGCSQLEYGIPNTPDTIFHVASVSKQFTAFALAILSEEGKLDLDAEIQEYLPDIPRFHKPITVRQLIHHVSGLRDQWQLLVLSGFRMDDVITHDQVMRLVKKQKALNFDPGAEFLYSNTGYTLMAEIVKQVSGQDLVDFCDKRIFKPLGMDNTHFHLDHEMIVKNRAYSYAPYYDYYKKRVLSYANVGATSLFTTVLDLVKWSNNFENTVVGNKELLYRILETYTLNDGKEIDYAFGLRISDYRGKKTISHGGADAGFRSHFVKFPEEDLTIVVLTNVNISKPEQLALRVADLYIFDDQLEEEIATNPPVSTQDIEGSYKMGPGMIVNITKKDKQFYIELPRTELSTLTKIDDNTFMIDVIGEKLLTYYDEQGNVEINLKHVFGRDTIAKKLELRHLHNYNLNDYIGTYYSEELSTSYKIRKVGDELVLSSIRMNDMPLLMLEKDKFEGKNSFAQIDFVRTDINKVTKLKLTGGRVRNIVFDKI
jgi:CubicO group peptidase (beta-lactamase class C family)